MRAKQSEFAKRSTFDMASLNGDIKVVNRPACASLNQVSLP